MKAVPLMLVAGALLLAPFTAGAASSRPSCTLTVTTPEDTETVKDEGEVLVSAGDKVSIAWKGKNAKTAKGPDRESTSVEGSTTVTAEESKTYTYEFSSGSRKETCSVEVNVVSAAFTEDRFESSSTKPTLRGTAEGVKEVRVRIESSEEGIKDYTTKDVKVKKGKWTVKTTKKLAEGTYSLTLLGPKSVGSPELAESELVVGDKKSAAKADTTLAVSSVPLLWGGVARANASIPLSYLQVSNVGTKPGQVTGFTVRQNGNASTDAVIGLSTVDDKGLSRAETTGTRPFSKNVATAPAIATLAPGEVKLFTIKAQIGPSVASYLGSALMIDVTGIETNGKVRASLPIKGTTWTFGF